MVIKLISRPGIMLVLILTFILSLSGSGNSCALIRDTGDLDGDGKPESYSLENNMLTVKEGDMILWKSPQSYHIDSFVLGDADNDGKIDLVISLWKNGSFGEIRPFWYTGEDTDCKNHLFVYRLQDKTFKQVWCSSNLDRPIRSFSIQDANGDGRNEMTVEEGKYKKVSDHQYALDLNSPMRTTIWKWEEWGFQLCE